jgi:hypothetical protein
VVVWVTVLLHVLLPWAEVTCVRGSGSMPARSDKFPAYVLTLRLFTQVMSRCACHRSAHLPPENRASRQRPAALIPGF